MIIIIIKLQLISGNTGLIEGAADSGLFVFHHDIEMYAAIIPLHVNKQ